MIKWWEVRKHFVVLDKKTLQLIFYVWYYLYCLTTKFRGYSHEYININIIKVSQKRLTILESKLWKMCILGLNMKKGTKELKRDLSFLHTFCRVKYIDEIIIIPISNNCLINSILCFLFLDILWKEGDIEKLSIMRMITIVQIYSLVSMLGQLAKIE